MKTISRVVLSGVCALGASVFAQEAAASLEFAAGRTEVVIAAGAPKTVEYAAQEACDILGQALGRRPEIVRAPRAGYSSIVLGDNEWGRAAGIDVQALKRDAFVIRAVGTRLHVVGRDDPRVDLPGIVAHGSLGNLEFERATLFGVYEFLERYAGVRFYFPGELGTVVPHTDAIVVPKDVDLAIAPAFTVRSFQMLGDGAVPGETNTVRWVPTSYGGISRRTCSSSDSVGRFRSGYGFGCRQSRSRAATVNAVSTIPIASRRHIRSTSRSRNGGRTESTSAT